MHCQGCGVDAETKHVTFYQNIGALILRFPSSIEGHLCKSCIHKHFWTMTGITAVFGWWGIISFIMTPFFLLNNVGRYVFCLGMASVPPGAMAPQLTEAAVQKIMPFIDELADRLKSGEDFTTVANSVAQRAGVTPGEVAMLVRAAAQAK